MYRLRSTALLATCAVVLAASLVACTPAFAWKSDGDPVWRSSKVTYFTVDPKLRPLVRQAAAAINASGAKVRLVEVKRRTGAKIIVGKPDAHDDCMGVARNTVRDGVRVSSVIRLSTKACRIHYDVRHTIAHELAHALGLGHETRTCAMMNPFSVDGIPNRCTTVKPKRWQAYCRMLEPDDVRGLVARYGGRARKVTAPQLCNRGPAPAAVTQPTVETTGSVATNDWRTVVSWTDPPAPAYEITLLVQRDTCASVDAELEMNYHLPLTPGVRNSKEFSIWIGEGSWCATLFAVDENGQPGTPSFLRFTAPPPPAL